MPACSGMNKVFSGLPRNAANDVRLLAGGIDADAEPRDAVTAKHSENRAGQNHRDRAEWFVLESLEIIHHADGDKHPQRGEKFSLLPQIGFARFPDDVGNVTH